MLSETDVSQLLDVLIYNLFCMVDVFFNSTDTQYSYPYPLCSLYADLFLYPYQADFIQRLRKKNRKKLARSFNFHFLYIDDVLSLNNSWSGDSVDRMYSIELEIKDTSALYLDLHLEIDSNGGLRTKHYDKGDVFNFSIVSFSFICSSIPAVPAYEVYISQLIRYFRACGSYQDFLDGGLQLTCICFACHNHNLVLSPFMT